MARISKKGIIVLSLIVISVTLVALFPANISPSITDVPTLDEEIEITTKLNKSDDISIEEKVSLDEKTELEFYIDPTDLAITAVSSSNALQADRCMPIQSTVAQCLPES